MNGTTSDPYQAPETAPTVLRGRVRNHPHFADGETLWSSPVMWIDYGEERVARTQSRRYTLGAMAADFLAFMETCNDGMANALASKDTSTTRRCYPNGPWRERGEE